MENRELTKDIILFTLYKWGNKYESPSKFLTEQFVKNHRVIFINGPYTIKDVIKNIKSLFANGKIYKLLPFQSGQEKVKLDSGNELLIINPPMLFSINSLPEGIIYNFFHKINHLLIAARINRFLKKKKLNDYIFINSFNFLYEKLDTYLKPSLNIYHCIDELIKPISLKHGKRQENEVIKRADLVVVTSKGLYNTKLKINSNCKIINNAVNVQHFLKATNNNLSVHESLSSISHPIIGYYGVLERRFNYELINFIAQKHPEWTFVLIGPQEKKYIPDATMNINNIKFLGYIPYDNLPSLLKGIDVAILPYKKDEVSKTIYPIKINEYLAAGKPVVLTNFNPDLYDDFSDVVHFAKDEFEFEKAIENSLAINNDDLIRKRIDKAKENSWSIRANEFMDLLDDELYNNRLV